ncbi:hypothetical protein [Spiroplasma endosymbiont of Lariophagus distinguendus]|uniref:hypothetical protein n=1 Tax=Spiroplasma endosymbiont of Lariophagus distinguendus TaxID=2935082 RepID=UPI002079673A|nr:hypothetical protein [Spiroplasma endosymbiont of Lariophagus distinguendus]
MKGFLLMDKIKQIELFIRKLNINQKIKIIGSQRTHWLDILSISSIKQINILLQKQTKTY